MHYCTCVLSDMVFLTLPKCAAYQPGLSWIDAIFFIQEALLNNTRDGSKPYLCPYDLEKAFGFPILLTALFDAGVDVKCWWLLKVWSSHLLCEVVKMAGRSGVVCAVKRSTLQVRQPSAKLFSSAAIEDIYQIRNPGETSENICPLHNALVTFMMPLELWGSVICHL